jgi:hypothetical protein
MAEIKDTKRAVMPGRVKLAEAARNHWVVTVEQGTSKEDLRRPEFWSLVAKTFRPYDRIEARGDDGSFFAEYLVLSADRAWAKVHELRFEALGTQDVSLTEAQATEQRQRYKVEWRGPHLKHCVERSDGTKVERLMEKFESKAEATIWLENHLKTVGGMAVAA